MERKLPFIKVRQKEKEFYLLKLDLKTLKRTINFHFRYPYLDIEEYNEKKIMNAENYIKSIGKKGITINKNINNNIEDDGVQRRISLTRVDEIKKFIEEEKESLLPGTIILSYNSYEDDPLIKKIIEEEEDYGSIDPDLFREGSTIVIDGQHRLAGMLTSRFSDDIDFEVPITLFLNNSLSESSVIFREINGKQESVNPSFVYDLYSNIPAESYLIEAKLHKVCKALNSSKNSPFFNQIKMQGTGTGAISQSFFIEYAKAALKKSRKMEDEAQEYLNMFVYYFKTVQNLYEKYWPVPQNVNDFTLEGLEEHAKNVLSKSKLAKTNGVGALFVLFPYLKGLTIEGRDVSFAEGLKYFDIDETNSNGGTGKGTQNRIAKNTLRELHKNGYKFNEDSFTKKIINNEE